jgi:hypothetical protein
MIKVFYNAYTNMIHTGYKRYTIKKYKLQKRNLYSFKPGPILFE